MKSDWIENKVRLEGIPIYCDASVDRDFNRVGIGYHSPILNLRYSGEYNMVTSSCKAELGAIFKVLQQCIEEEVKDKTLSIILDSKSGLMLIQRQKTSSTTLKCIKFLIEKLISMGNLVRFYWIPSHTNIQSEHFIGNEIADELANDPDAAQCYLLPSLPLSKKEIKNILMNTI